MIICCSGEAKASDQTKEDKPALTYTLPPTFIHPSSLTHPYDETRQVPDDMNEVGEGSKVVDVVNRSRDFENDELRESVEDDSSVVSFSTLYKRSKTHSTSVHRKSLLLLLSALTNL